MPELKIIRNYVEEATGINLASRVRNKPHKYARAVYNKLAKENTTFSVEEIGFEVGINHSSVLNSIKNTFPEAMRLRFYKSLYEQYNNNEVKEYSKLQHKYDKLYVEHLKLTASYDRLNVIVTNMSKNLLLEPHEELYRTLSPEKRAIFVERVQPILKFLEL